MVRDVDVQWRGVVRGHPPPPPRDLSGGYPLCPRGSQRLLGQACSTCPDAEIRVSAARRWELSIQPASLATSHASPPGHHVARAGTMAGTLYSTGSIDGLGLGLELNHALDAVRVRSCVRSSCACGALKQCGSVWLDTAYRGPRVFNRRIL